MDVADPDLENDEIPTSYVPFRNANLLLIATSCGLGTSRSTGDYFGAEVAFSPPDLKRTTIKVDELTHSLYRVWFPRDKAPVFVHTIRGSGDRYGVSAKAATNRQFDSC
jgi:hypothetical protein